MNEFILDRSLTREDATFVEIEAENQLYEALKAGKLCYVLESRQTGKTTLCFSIIEKLKNDKIDTAFITLDDGEIDDAKVDSWYADQMDTISRELKLGIKIGEWLKEYNYLSPLRRFGKFIELFLLNKNIVIFIDEIDAVLGLPFPTDDYFTYIRSVCDTKKNKRLTFCLLGVTSPNNLIKNKERTPFNKGIPITLKPFNIRDVQPLINGLQKFGYSIKAMEEILYWTGGQPFLTQKLCDLVVKNSIQGILTPEQEIEIVKSVVESKIIDNWEYVDDPPHLKTIKDRLIGQVENRAFELLSLYQKVLLETLDAKNDDEAQIELKLTGVVRQENGKLKVYNPIYKIIFDIEWVKHKIEWLKKKLANIKPYAEKFEAWLEANEEIKQRYLLYGTELEYASKWIEGKKITNEYQTFLSNSEAFRQKVIERFPFNPEHFEDTNEEQVFGEDDSKYCTQEQLLIVTGVILGLTGGVLLLNKCIFSKAKTTFKKAIPRGEEQSYIEDKLIPKLLEDEKVKKHSQKIADEIVNYTDSFLMMSSYKEILEQEEINFNDSPEHQKLIDMCLIIKEGNNKLKILNKIYPLLFNQRWFDETLKHITTDLVNKIWQSTTEEEKSQAVEIITKFQPQLKGKTNHLYSFIQEVLEKTVIEHKLMEKLLEKACESQVNIPSENQKEWIEQQVKFLTQNDKMYELLLQCWTVAYEKAIVAKEYKLAKKTIDKACCEAVEYLTQRLLEAESITAEDTVNRSQETMEDSIRHHIDNLTKGGMFNPDQKLNIEARTLQIEERTEKVVEITVDNCTYQEGCKWALGEPVFRENGQYRCQRLGCFVGAVKKYMTEENLPEDKRKKLDYLMTTVMESTDEYQKAGINCQCKGFIVVNENFTRQSLLQDNPTQLPT